MNWHLFADVIAWVACLLATVGAISAALIKYDGQRVLLRQAVVCAFLAALCWAWIIAG